MTSKERIIKTLNFQKTDRISITEMSFWPQTLERWHKEGLPEDVSPHEYFKMDLIKNCCFNKKPYEEEIIKETEEYCIKKDGYGKTIKILKGDTYCPAQPLKYSIKTKEDFDLLKKHLLPEQDRITNELIKTYAQYRGKEAFICVTPDEPCWFVLERTMGMDRGLIEMSISPEFVREIMDYQTDFSLEMIKIMIKENLKPDAVWLYGDLCYKNGMLFSPSMYRELVMPFHKKIKEFCVENDLYLIYHCDGNVKEFIPLLIEVGVDCIQPLEARAGNDVRELKKLYGKDITFFGNINMDILAKGNKKEIENEVVTKIETAKKGGGYIFNSDHSVPPTVSFEDYSFAIKLARKHGNY
ncbi:hypothetical protein KKC91_04140 [bacterium]|nr:hypothetical protein [bacterium]